MNGEKFIFCLEAVNDAETAVVTETVRNLEALAYDQGIDSIYQVCDTIEGLEESLNALLHNDHNFKNYEVIYLVMPGEANNICLNDYYYSLEEIAEIFEGRLKGKILHFANAKVLDLSDEEAQYFLDITGAKAISGYGGEALTGRSSACLRKTKMWFQSLKSCIGSITPFANCWTSGCIIKLIRRQETFLL